MEWNKPVFRISKCLKVSITSKVVVLLSSKFWVWIFLYLIMNWLFTLYCLIIPQFWFQVMIKKHLEGYRLNGCAYTCVYHVHVCLYEREGVCAQNMRFGYVSCLALNSLSRLTITWLSLDFRPMAVDNRSEFLISVKF